MLQRLGLKRADPEQRGQYTSQQGPGRRPQSGEQYGYKPSDAQISAAPTEMQSGGMGRLSPRVSGNPLDYAVSGAAAYYQSDSKMTSTDGQDYQVDAHCRRNF